eukprot:840095-Amphidinium_carterae.1
MNQKYRSPPITPSQRPTKNKHQDSTTYFRKTCALLLFANSGVVCTVLILFFGRNRLRGFARITSEFWIAKSRSVLTLKT